MDSIQRLLLPILLTFGIATAVACVSFSAGGALEPPSDSPAASDTAMVGEVGTPGPGATGSVTGVTAVSSPTPGGPIPVGPNVLLITLDTTRADHLSSYGNPRVRTPTFDGLATRGVRFDMAITQFSQTNPAHASILTGTYAATHGLRWHGVDKLGNTVTTLAEVLAAIGFDTAAVYSWVSLDPESGLDRGFRSYQAAYFNRWPDGPTLLDQLDGEADVTTDMAIRWLSKRAAGAPPFFLWVHYQDPHFPYAPPPPYDQMYTANCGSCPKSDRNTLNRVLAGTPVPQAEMDDLIAHYDAEITFTDHEVGRLLDEMKRRGVLEDTVVVVVADHGESFGENGMWFHPWVLYNTVVRVPLIISYPPALPQGVTIREAVQTIDVMPTLLELLGIPSPSDVDGVSLVALMNGKGQADGWVAYTEELNDPSMAVTTNQWKLIRDNLNGGLQLYDLRIDPRETSNLATVWPDTAAELAAKIVAFLNSHRIVPRPFS